MEKPNFRQRKLVQEYKKTLSLSKNLFEIGIGTLLGDASLQTQDHGKTYRLKFSQSEKNHRDYLFHLHEIFDNWVLSPPHFNGKPQMWRFQTISHSDFTPLAQIFVLDSNGLPCKKHIKPNFVDQFITPRVLSYWIMDDEGRSCYNKDFERKGFVLNTQGFSEIDVDILYNELKLTYGLNCWLKPNKKGFVIVISGKNYPQMINLLTPYIIPSMRYKIPGYSQ